MKRALLTISLLATSACTQGVLNSSNTESPAEKAQLPKEEQKNTAGEQQANNAAQPKQDTTQCLWKADNGITLNLEHKDHQVLLVDAFRAFSYSVEVVGERYATITFRFKLIAAADIELGGDIMLATSTGRLFYKFKAGKVEFVDELKPLTLHNVYLPEGVDEVVAFIFFNGQPKRFAFKISEARRKNTSTLRSLALDSSAAAAFKFPALPLTADLPAVRKAGRRAGVLTFKESSDAKLSGLAAEYDVSLPTGTESLRSFVRRN